MNENSITSITNIRNKIEGIIKNDDVKRLRKYLNSEEVKWFEKNHWCLWEMFFPGIIYELAYDGKINCLRYIFDFDFEPDICLYGEDYLAHAILGGYIEAVRIIETRTHGCVGCPPKWAFCQKRDEEKEFRESGILQEYLNEDVCGIVFSFTELSDEIISEMEKILHIYHF